MLEQGPQPANTQAHHELPWTFRGWFAEKGLNVNDPAYGKWVGASHQAWTNTYERSWKGFKRFNPSATKAEVLAFLDKLRANIKYN